MQHAVGANLQIDALAFHSADAGRFTLEAEDFASFHNIGDQMIQRLPLTGCSSGYILYGLDTAGEWTEYEVAIPAAGTYEITLICRGNLGESYSLKLSIAKPVDPLHATWGVVKYIYE